MWWKYLPERRIAMDTSPGRSLGASGRVAPTKIATAGPPMQQTKVPRPATMRQSNGAVIAEGRAIPLEDVLFGGVAIRNKEHRKGRIV